MALTKSPQTILASYEKQLDQALGKYPMMLKIERKVGVPKARLVGGLGILIIGYALLQLAASMLISSIIFGYPAYMTMKALESGSKIDHSAWLAYWTAVALFQLLESFSGNAFANVIPFYSILKIAFHLWLSLPITQVSNWGTRKCLSFLNF
jgi:receptor expression-enhancing protein 5/6